MASNASLLQFLQNHNQYPKSYASEYQDELSIGALEKQLELRSESIFDDESNSYVDFCETTSNGCRRCRRTGCDNASLTAYDRVRLRGHQRPRPPEGSLTTDGI